MSIGLFVMVWNSYCFVACLPFVSSLFHSMSWIFCLASLTLETCEVAFFCFCLKKLMKSYLTVSEIGTETLIWSACLVFGISLSSWIYCCCCSSSSVDRTRHIRNLKIPASCTQLRLFRYSLRRILKATKEKRTENYKSQANDAFAMHSKCLIKSIHTKNH